MLSNGLLTCFCRMKPVACSSQRDVLDNMFWPERQMVKAEADYGDDAQATRANHHFYGDYRRGRDSSHDDQKRYYDHDHDADWPDCLGGCFAGACTLKQTRPGCCYLQATGAYPTSDAATPAKSQTASQAAPGSADAGDGNYGAYRAKRELVCWRDEVDVPHLVD